MAEPWPVTQHPDAPEMWIVEDDRGKSGWLDEQAARRYAAMPVMLELARQVVAYSCESYVREDIVISARAALKAAGEDL